MHIEEKKEDKEKLCLWRNNPDDRWLIQARVDCLRNHMRSPLEIPGMEEAWADWSCRKFMSILVMIQSLFVWSRTR